MAEALDARELVEALQPERDADFFPLNDLPNDVLVSVFAAAENPTWVRHTFPLVCKAWNELYLTKDASPLHETLEVDFGKEVGVVAREWEGEEDEEWVLPVVHASRVLAWAERRAGSVRKLDLKRGKLRYGSFRAFSSEELGALVAVVGSSLTGISIGFGIREVLKRPFWESLRDSVVPAGRLRSFVVAEIDADTFRSGLEPLLGQLAGSLEELVLETRFCRDPSKKGLPRFPESLFALKELRRLALDGQPRITAIPAGISRLKKLEDLELRDCGLSSLPKELGELSGLTKLDLSCNESLGNTLPVEEAFPAELKKMKSLRWLHLLRCSLRTVPAFVGELKSLESLALCENDLSSLPKELGELSRLTKLDVGGNRSLRTALPADEAFPAELGKMKCLRKLSLNSCDLRTVPAFVGELKSLQSLDLWCCDISSLPKELGELSALTRLDLASNINLGSLPESETFPAELGKMKPLRDLRLSLCGLSAVPSFVRELKSLEILTIRANGFSSLPKELGELSRLTKLDVGDNRNLGTTAEAFPAELGKMKSLRDLDLRKCGLRTVPSFVGKLESLESLTLQRNDLSSLSKELGELSGLTKLDLSWNESLGNTLPVEEAFPAELGDMKCLRELELSHCRLRTVPSFVGELKSLESLTLQKNDLSSLPKELGELSGLTKLELKGNYNLGTLPQDEAFPAELGNMKCLRKLSLNSCGLRTVPAFLGELESLEVLHLKNNSSLQIDAPLDFLIEGCPRLREVRLRKWHGRDPWTPRSLANLEAFKAKLRAKNPHAEVHTSHKC